MRKSRELPELIDPPETPIGNVAAVRAILVAAAKAGKAISYAEALDALGHRFTRPKMRALCKTLDAVDQRATAAGEPELAVLVVRQSDRLPGQGWWVGKVQQMGYDGPWTGDAALKFVRRQQKLVFDHWGGKNRNPARKNSGKTPKASTRRPAPSRAGASRP